MRARVYKEAPPLPAPDFLPTLERKKYSLIIILMSFLSLFLTFPLLPLPFFFLSVSRSFTRREGIERGQKESERSVVLLRNNPGRACTKWRPERGSFPRYLHSRFVLIKAIGIGSRGTVPSTLIYAPFGLPLFPSQIPCRLLTYQRVADRL